MSVDRLKNNELVNILYRVNQAMALDVHEPKFDLANKEHAPYIGRMLEDVRIGGLAAFAEGVMFGIRADEEKVRNAREKVIKDRSELLANPSYLSLDFNRLPESLGIETSRYVQTAYFLK